MSETEYISKTIARLQTIAEIRALGIDVSDEYREKVKEDYAFLPSADVEPVRHGRWIAVTVSSGRDSWRCSECGRHARGKLENLPYCHCGAKMDGGNDD